jgi:hypothetical protein
VSRAARNSATPSPTAPPARRPLPLLLGSAGAATGAAAAGGGACSAARSPGSPSPALCLTRRRAALRAPGFWLVKQRCRATSTAVGGDSTAANVMMSAETGCTEKGEVWKRSPSHPQGPVDSARGASKDAAKLSKGRVLGPVRSLKIGTHTGKTQLGIDSAKRPCKGNEHPFSFGPWACSSRVPLTGNDAPNTHAKAACRPAAPIASSGTRRLVPTLTGKWCFPWGWQQCKCATWCQFIG